MSRLNPLYILGELRRRRVLNTLVIYICGAWVALQAAELAFPGFDIPESAIAYVWLGAFLLLPLALLLGWKYDVHVTGIERTPGATSAGDFDTSLQRPDRWLIGGMGIMALLVISVMLNFIAKAEPGDVDEITPNSIAVMPFVWCHDTVEDIALAGGIHAAVVNRLANRERLRVIGRNTVHKAASSGLPLDLMPELFRVQYLLQGELCRDGVDLVLQTELTDRDQVIVWSETFRQVVVRGDQVEQQLATLVANGVALELGEVAVVEIAGPVNVRALELLRIAQHHGQNEAWEEAEKYLENALEYESEYAEAIFELARARANKAQITGKNPDSYIEFIETGWPLGEKALGLARAEIERGTHDFQPFAVAARILTFMSWWVKEIAWRESSELSETEIADRMATEHEMLLEAEEHIRNAIALNPSDSSLRVTLVRILERQGPVRLGESLEILEQARKTEPFDEQVAVLLAQNLAQRGQYEQAMEELERFSALGEISEYLRWEQFEIQQGYGRDDDRLELLLFMLEHETGKFSRTQNALAHLFWVSSDMPYYGLDEEAEALHRKLEAIPERADANSWERWARQFFLVDKYLQATGQAEKVAKEKLAEIEGLSNEEIVDRWYLRVAVYAHSFWVVGERNRAIELSEALSHHRMPPRWAHRAAQMKMGLVNMYLTEDRIADAAPVLEEVVELLEVALAAGVRHPMSLFYLASAYAAQGHHDEALEMLAMAVDYDSDALADRFDETELLNQPFGDIAFIEWRALQKDPDFIRLKQQSQAILERKAANMRALLDSHDIDQLLAPVIEMHAASYEEELIKP